MKSNEFEILQKKIGSKKVWKLGAFAWGFLEGTFFFIIPDLIISLVALTSFKKGLKSAVWALIGSLCGAMTLFFIASHISVDSFLLSIPLISTELIQTATKHLTEFGSMGVIFGPVNGIPHKIYSLHASLLHLPLLSYLLYSAVSRFLRFCIVAIGSSIVGYMLQKYFKKTTSLFWIVFGSFWSLVYIIYILTI